MIDDKASHQVGKSWAKRAFGFLRGPKNPSLAAPRIEGKKSDMPTLLAIEVSPRYDASTSRKLTEVYIENWQKAHPDGIVIRRNLMKTNLPFVDIHWIIGAFTPEDTHSAEAVAAIKVSNDLVAELKSASHIVIGTPMFNFSIPAVLKAYIDHVVRVGVTVSPDNRGLLVGKKADVILASGGDFSPGSPVEQYNQASGYLRQVLGWMGITDVEFTLAGRAKAGDYGENAISQFGEIVARAASRDVAASTDQARAS